MVSPIPKLMKRHGGSKPGERRGGRQKGTPNKATLEKRAIAAVAQMEAANAPLQQRELAKDTLLRIMVFCEGAVAANRPTTALELKAKKPENPDGNWQRALDWAKLWAWCSDRRAAYESPKLLGIGIAPPPPVIDETAEPEIIRLRVFEGNRQVKLIERKSRDVA